MKACIVCGETKLADDFYRDSAKKDGKRSICKDCDKEHRKAAYRRRKAEGKLPARYNVEPRHAARDFPPHLHEAFLDFMAELAKESEPIREYLRKEWLTC